MLNAETTPLVTTKDIPRKSNAIWFLCLATITILLIVIFYHGNNSPLAANTYINNPMLEQTRYPKYPLDAKLAKHRELTRIIEYKPEDIPQGVDLSDFYNTQTREFQSELIQKHGYDPELHHIIFSVPDTVSYESADIESDGKGTITSEDKLQCKYMHTTSSTSGAFMEINCPNDEVITGCTSIARYAGGVRWGESAYYTSHCYTHAASITTTQSYATLLTARCCKVTNSKLGTSTQLMTTYDTSDTSNSDFCVETECDTDMTSIGCAATDSHQMMDEFSGTIWLKTSETTSGCRAQRGEMGYLWQTSYCGKLLNTNKNLICKTVNGNVATIRQSSGDYESQAICSAVGEGYTLTDCNGHIKPDIDYCTARKAYGNDRGILYGSYMFTGGLVSQINPICFAAGSTDAVLAQAVCCKIE
eukprot:255764_1